jgi:hypothetical protein
LDTAPTVARQEPCTALFARIQAQDRHALVAADELGVGAGRTGDLTALAGLQLDIVDDRADRHADSGIALPGFTSTVSPETTLSPAQTLRREDVGQLAVLVLDQRDEGGAVRIVFEPLDGRRRRRTCGA